MLLPVAVAAAPAAAQTAPVPPPQQPQATTSAPPPDDGAFSLDLDNRLDVGVAWPDLNAAEVEQPAPEATAPETTVAAEQPASGVSAGGAVPSPPDDATDTEDMAENGHAMVADDGSEHRYTVTVNGVEPVADSLFWNRFHELSVLEQGRRKPANLAQINRRMRLDAELLDRIVQAKGYYDAVVRQSVRPASANDGNGKLRVLFDVRTGQRYTVAHILLPGLAFAAGHVPSLRTAFPVNVGDPVDADAIMAAHGELSSALLNNGFPFASVAQPEVTIDHDTQKGDLEVVVHSGGYRLFGDIVIDDTTRRLFSARHLQRIARFDPDDVYNAADVEDLRRAIIATGLASSVTLKPRDANDGKHVNVAVDVTPAKMRTISGAVGYGTGEGYRLEASWQHRNFFPPEGALTVRGLLGTKEQGGGVTYRRNNFLRRDHILSASVALRHQQFDAYEAKSATLSASLERETNILYQKKWAWSVGTEFTATRERDTIAGGSVVGTRNYLIAALPGSLTYDASNDLLDPTRGFRLGARISPEMSNQGGTTTGYVRAQIDGSLYVPASQSVVLASRVRLGSILGGISSDRVAPSRRYYAGGAASVRGYGYQAIGPRDLNNNPIGGKSLAEFSLEARIRFGVFGVVPFVDAGNISTGFLPRLNNVRFGTGLGLRYYSNFGPIRIDVGTPLNRQPGDSRIAVYVSLGQAF